MLILKVKEYLHMEKPVRIRSLFILLAVLLSLVKCGSNDKQANDKVKILIVHSYHIEYPWTRSIHDGIMDVLGNKGFTLQTYFMDTKRNTDEAFKINAGQKALDVVRTFKPAVVITVDDNAQEYFGKFLVGTPDTRVVFCGVNEIPEKYNYPGNNVTGICERPFIRSSLNLLEKVAPHVRSYTIFTDNSETSKGFITYLQSLNLPIQIDKIMVNDDFDQWKKDLAAIQSDAVITYMYHTVRSKGQSVEPKQVMKWTIAHLDKPTIGFFDFAIEDGVLLGYVESGFEHGELAAKRAVEIINGKKTTELPIISAKKGIFMVNKITAAQLHIDVFPLENIADKIIR